MAQAVDTEQAQAEAAELRRGVVEWASHVPTLLDTDTPEADAGLEVFGRLFADWRSARRRALEAQQADIEGGSR